MKSGGIPPKLLLTKTGKSGHLPFGVGDALTLLASLLFTGQVLLLDRLGRRMRPAHFSVAFLGTTGALGAAGAALTAAVGPGCGPWLGWTAEPA